MIGDSVLRTAALITVVLVAAGISDSVTAAKYKVKIAEMQAEHAVAVAALEAKYRVQEQKAAKQLSDAWAQRDAALADALDLRADADRVRDEAATLRRRLSAAGAGACQPERERLARCSELLEAGAELAARGAEFSQRIAIEKDAIAKLSP